LGPILYYASRFATQVTFLLAFSIFFFLMSGKPEESKMIRSYKVEKYQEMISDVLYLLETGHGEEGIKSWKVNNIYAKISSLFLPSQKN